MKVLFVSSGNNYLECPIAYNQAKSITNFDSSIEIEHFRIIGKGLFGYLKNLKPLRKKIKHFKPDLIHSHYSFSGYLSVLSFTRVPKITSLMGSDVQLKGFWKLLLLLFSKFWDVIIVKSLDMKIKCGIRKALIIPNGVDLNQFEKIEKNTARKILNLDLDKLYVLFLADPTRPEKNYLLAKQSVELLNNRNIELLSVHNISFNETKFYYYAVDVVLMTSKYEGSPNVIKEAMACNKPIVSTNVGDVKLLLNKLDGCFVVESKPLDIASAIKNAFNFNQDTKGKIRLIELGIDSKSIAKKIITEYNQILYQKLNQTVSLNEVSENYIQCRLGLWDSKIPGIKFNNDGVSNFALLQIKLMSDYPRGDLGRNDWKEIINKIKKSGRNKKYDCVIGVSGGVDSSYLLHIAKEIGLKPLAVHLDNGFNSEIAVSNIQSITTKLNIDLYTHVINYEEIKDLFRSYMLASLPWIDAPTDLAIKAIMYKVACKYNIKYILRGNDFRSEGKQPKEWTYSDVKQLKYVHNQFGKLYKLKTYPYFTIWNLFNGGLIKSIKDIRPYYFIDYNKENAKKTLIKEYSWRDYGGHHHENLFTKFAMAFWLPKKFDIDKRKINLSAQILSGAITKDRAKEKILEEFDTKEELENLKKFIIKKLDFSDKEFQQLYLASNKNYTDYPNNYNLIYNNIDKFKWIIKKMYGFKPMSIDSSIIIDKK